jgi:hypothetical protein
VPHSPAAHLIQTSRHNLLIRKPRLNERIPLYENCHSSTVLDKYPSAIKVNGLTNRGGIMGEVFIVQKRPAHGVLNGFYYRIVDIRTGEAVNRNFLQAVQAEAHCHHLNEGLSRLATADSSRVNLVPDW